MYAVNNGEDLEVPTYGAQNQFLEQLLVISESESTSDEMILESSLQIWLFNLTNVDACLIK